MFHDVISIYTGRKLMKIVLTYTKGLIPFPLARLESPLL